MLPFHFRRVQVVSDELECFCVSDTDAFNYLKTAAITASNCAPSCMVKAWRSLASRCLQCFEDRFWWCYRLPSCNDRLNSLPGETG